MLKVKIKEKWRAIKGYKSLYEISDFGNVYSCRSDKILKSWVNYHGRHNSQGYFMVSLSKNGKVKKIPVHRLVLETFVGSCPEGCECNHKDGNTQNNWVRNLEWVTFSKNNKHAYKLGLKKYGEDNCRAKLTDRDVKKIRKLYATGNYFQIELGEMFGVRDPQISRIINWKTRKRYC